MENLAKLVEQLVNKTNTEKNNLEQISKFDETLKMLRIKDSSEKTTYNFPLIDTLGTQTYSNLNRR